MPKYIDADKVLDTMRSVMDMQELYLPTHFIDLVIDGMQSEDVEPVRHGRWVCVEAEPEKVWCDYCKTDYRSSDLLNIGADDEKVNFCPNCGAKMDGREDDD